MGVVASFGNQVARFVADFQFEPSLAQPRSQAVELDLYDVVELLTTELPEYQRLVDPVQKFGAEVPTQRFVELSRYTRKTSHDVLTTRGGPPLARDHRLDQLLGCDVVEIGAGNREVRVSELLLDHVHRDTFASQLGRHRVPQAVRVNALLDSGLMREAPEQSPHVRGLQRPRLGRAEDRRPAVAPGARGRICMLLWTTAAIP